METRNVTLALPGDLLRELKIVAAKRDRSLSALLTETLRGIVDEESGYAEAQRASMAALKKGFDLGTGGQITWTRDELHER